VDVTPDVRQLATNRGRSKQMDAFSAGTASVALQDFDDRYNAWNPAGIWSADTQHRTHIPLRVRALTTNRTDYLFSGTTDAVEDSWPGTVDARTEVQATDAFKSLARQTLPVVVGVGAGELGGARIGRLLDAAAYSGTRDLNAGAAHFAATTMGDIALDLIDQIREGEAGAFYIAGDGTATFRDQGALATDPRMASVQWTFVDRDEDAVNATYTCYSELTLETNDEQIVNKASVTRPGGSAQVFQDASSVAWYGPRTYTVTDIPFADDVAALTLAQIAVQLGANNEQRIDAIIFYPLHQANGVNVATGLRLMDRIRLLRHTPGGNTIDSELLVQSISHDVAGGGADQRAGTWRVTVGTASASLTRGAALWDRGQWDADKWGA